MLHRKFGDELAEVSSITDPLVSFRDVSGLQFRQWQEEQKKQDFLPRNTLQFWLFGHCVPRFLRQNHLQEQPGVKVHGWNGAKVKKLSTLKRT